jgi:hypothetical protein
MRNVVEGEFQTATWAMNVSTQDDNCRCGWKRGDNRLLVDVKRVMIDIGTDSGVAASGCHHCGGAGPKRECIDDVGEMGHCWCSVQLWERIAAAHRIIFYCNIHILPVKKEGICDLMRDSTSWLCKMKEGSYRVTRILRSFR